MTTAATKLDERLQGLSDQISNDELEMIVKARGFLIFMRDGQSKKGRPLPDTTGKPLTRNAVSIADYAGKMRRSFRWFLAYDNGYKAAVECNVLGQLQAFNLIESRLGGMIDPKAQDTPYKEGQIEALNAVQNLITKSKENCEARDEELT